MGRGSKSKLSEEQPAPTKLFRDLLNFRIKSGLDPSEVARRMGVPRQRVYGMETGRDGDPSSRTLERYAKAIGAEIHVTKKD